MVEKVKAYKDELVTVRELMRGTILRHRSVSRSGRTSAVVFIPNYFLGMKVKLIVIPEDEEAVAIRKALEKRIKNVGRLQEEIRKLKSKELERSDNASETPTEEVPKVEKDLEGDDEY